MLHGNAAEGIDFYLSVFNGASLEEIARYGPGEQAPEGTVQHARLRVGGAMLSVIDSAVAQSFSFTPGTSLVVEDDDRGMLQRIWARLSDGGRVLMPLGQYPFSDCFGWVTDRYGVSWQLTAGGG